MNGSLKSAIKCLCEWNLKWPRDMAIEIFKKLKFGPRRTDWDTEVELKLIVSGCDFRNLSVFWLLGA